MGSNNWGETLDTIIADGTQISNSTTETIVCPDYNFNAFYMSPGRVLRVSAFGILSNVVTTPGTLTMRLRWGGVAGVVLAASGAMALDTTARTSYPWWLTAFVICRTQGATGTFMSMGAFETPDTLSSTAANLLAQLMTSAGSPAANAVVTVDTTAAKLFSVTAQFSVATSPTNLTCQGRIIEVLN